jgi:hypothetical protein
MVAAIESSSFVLPLQVAAGNLRVASAPICAEANNDAGPEEPAAVNLAAFSSVCQWQNPGFHRIFAVFPGFSLENG